MKAAILLPHDLLVRVDEFAKDLGISRSQLIAAALGEFIKILQSDDWVTKINAACTKFETRLPIDIARISRQKLLETEFTSSNSRFPG